MPLVRNSESTTQTDLVSFTNTLSIASRWLGGCLAPFGDHPRHRAGAPRGRLVPKFSAIQRLDRAAAEAMVAKFKSPWQRLKRYFTGCPIWCRAIPTRSAFAGEYADQSSGGDDRGFASARRRPLLQTGFHQRRQRPGRSIEKIARVFRRYWSANLAGEEMLALLNCAAGLSP